MVWMKRARRFFEESISDRAMLNIGLAGITVMKRTAKLIDIQVNDKRRRRLRAERPEVARRAHGHDIPDWILSDPDLLEKRLTEIEAEYKEKE